MQQADISEFNSQRNKLPGDREGIAAVGPYILELYFDPLGTRPSAVIEINKKDSNGTYEKETSIWFNPTDEDNPEEDASERVFSDPEQTARERFKKLSQSKLNVEDCL